MTTIISTRPALVKALDAAVREWERNGGQLLAVLDRHVSAVVVDADTLADDDALVEAFRGGWLAADARGESGGRVKAGLRALAGALAERGESR